MIIRAWQGRSVPSQSGAYPEHFRRTVVPELERIEGFLGASLLREVRDDEVEFLVLTHWSSLEAIRAFAGADIGNAVVDPGAAAALSSFDSRVRHYDVVEEVTRPVLLNAIGV